MVKKRRQLQYSMEEVEEGSESLRDREIEKNMKKRQL